MTKPARIDRAKEDLGKAAARMNKVARSTTTQLAEKAANIKDTAVGNAEKITTKRPDPYEEAVAEYSGTFVAMNDKGLSLLRQRERSTDLIEFVELLVNSVVNTPKTFATDLEAISAHKAKFRSAEEFARDNLEAARKSAASAGAGFTAGAAVASMAPSAAMWVATTFGTASTGTAISTLSGAAATNAALAWLGGGALAAGGGGTAAGSALLALAGPVGWTVAGATLLASIGLYAKKRSENRKEMHEALSAVKHNTALVREMDARIDDLLQRTVSLRERLKESYGEALGYFGADFLELSASQQSQLAALVNNAKACAAQIRMHVNPDPEDE